MSFTPKFSSSHTADWAAVPNSLAQDQRATSPASPSRRSPYAPVSPRLNGSPSPMPSRSELPRVSEFVDWERFRADTPGQFTSYRSSASRTNLHTPGNRSPLGSDLRSGPEAGNRERYHFRTSAVPTWREPTPERLTGLPSIHSIHTLDSSLAAPPPRPPTAQSTCGASEQGLQDPASYASCLDFLSSAAQRHAAETTRLVHNNHVGRPQRERVLGHRHGLSASQMRLPQEGYRDAGFDRSGVYTPSSAAFTLSSGTPADSDRDFELRLPRSWMPSMLIEEEAQNEARAKRGGGKEKATLDQHQKENEPLSREDGAYSGEPSALASLAMASLAARRATLRASDIINGDDNDGETSRRKELANDPSADANPAKRRRITQTRPWMPYPQPQSQSRDSTTLSAPPQPQPQPQPQLQPQLQPHSDTPSLEVGTEVGAEVGAGASPAEGPAPSPTLDNQPERRDLAGRESDSSRRLIVLVDGDCVLDPAYLRRLAVECPWTTPFLHVRGNLYFK
ncbi:hypothetical protein F4819DRAFT_482806 [Hypoxylon fuscum]|nr:hypothetical protein F4819DRAFT_482806 [Hypoxylon fuscum]